jgi:hypothetical protein
MQIGELAKRTAAQQVPDLRLKSLQGAANENLGAILNMCWQ